MDPKWLAKRVQELADEAASVSWEDMPKTWWDENAKSLSPEFGSWSSRASSLLRAHFREPSPVYWAIAEADRRMGDVFAEPRSSFERVKDLYLKALRLALKELRAKDPGAGDSR